MSVPVPQGSDGYVDLLQIDLGTVDGDSNTYVNVRALRRFERTADAGMHRTDIVRMERAAPAVMRRIDE